MLKELKDFGLTEKEITIYLSLTKTGSLTAGELSKISKINRSTSYVILDILQEKGLLSVSFDGKVKKYTVSSPEAIIRIAEENLQKHNNILNDLKNILPNLQSIRKSSEKKPRIRLFEGKEGLINAFEDSLNTKEKLIRISSSVGNLFKILPNFFPKYVQKRIQLGIRMYGIHPLDKHSKQLVATMPKNFDKPILIPKNKFSFPADFAIYDNTIGYMSAENGGIAILIDSKEISQVMKIIFDLAFKEAEKLSIK